MKKIKTRTMTMDFDVVKVEGEAWSKDPLNIVLETWCNGGVTKRVIIPMRPVDVEYLSEQLWKLHARYQKAADSVKRALSSPST